MQYMCLLYSAPAPANEEGPAPGTPEFDAMMAPWNEVTETFIRDGVMGGGEALMPPEMATRLQVRNGKTETMDGPYAETKEQLGGFYILNCDDLDTALKYAAMIPTATEGTIEVRPVMDLGN